MSACPSCGQLNPETARFCLACGAQLTAKPSRRQVRKTVTVLFCDVTDYTARGEQLDPDPTAGDVIQVLSVAIRLGATIEGLAVSIHVYPTFSEIVKGAAEQAVPAPAPA